MKFLVTVGIVALIAVVAFALADDGGRVSAQGIPDGPYIFSGTVTVDGAAPPDGLTVHARVVGAGYRSEPVAVVGGKYEGLSVALEGSRYDGMDITFYLGANVQAAETETYYRQGFPKPVVDFALTFPNLPPPTPTPTPDPRFVTPTVTPTPTPAIPDAMVFAWGSVILGEGDSLPDGARLTARVGGYESQPARIRTAGGRYEYENLSVDPRAVSAIGGTVLFFIDGKAAQTTATFAGGETRRGFDIRFSVAIAPPTATPTATSIPTATPPADRHGDAHANADAELHDVGR